jgi:hypothetical protein
MFFGRSLKKDVGPSIDEEAEIGCIGRLPSTLDAIGLIDCLAELSRESCPLGCSLRLPR